MNNAPRSTAITLDHPGAELITGSLLMPFAYGRNRATSAVEPRSLAWLAEHGLIERGSAAETTLRAASFHELAGLVFRREDEDALQITADYIAALFFLDDLVDTNQSHLGMDSALARRAAAMLGASVRSGKAPSRDTVAGWPLTRADQHKLIAVASALADVARRLVDHCDPAALEPFFREVDVYFESLAREAAHRTGRDYQSLADYASVRIEFSAVHSCIEIGLALRGVALSPETRRDGDLARAMESANLSVSYVNDLFSYKKERLLGERSNLIMVIERLDRAPLAAAFEEACRATDGVMHTFSRSRAAIEARDPSARAATELCETWIRGNYDWHAGGTQRYARALSTHAAEYVIDNIGEAATTERRADEVMLPV